MSDLVQIYPDLFINRDKILKYDNSTIQYEIYGKLALCANLVLKKD